jgi:hypothetical protein
MSRQPAVVVALAAAVIVLGTGRNAHAQWYAAAYLGGDHTHSATVSIDQPGDGVSLQFHDVDFEARPLKSPQYYGWRFGRMFANGRRIGLEFEFIHLKAYAVTDRPYEVSGNPGVYGNAPLAPMNTVVSRYAMSHGLNFLLVNMTYRRPVSQGAMAIVARGGVGPTMPHAESTVGGVAREQYEFGGLGVHGAAGIDVKVYRGLSGVVEYKLTYGRPEITIAGGSGSMTAISHHVAVGLAFGLPR